MPKLVGTDDDTMLFAAVAVLSLQRPNLQAKLRRSDLQIGQTVVPTLAGEEIQPSRRDAVMARRQRMFDAGLYPGVDYEIEGSSTDATGELLLTVKPIYPLIEKLEREDWPVTVPFSLASRWMSPTAYNLLTATVTLALVTGGLLLAVALSSVVTFSVVPSESMVPAILPRDVLLVEKLSPRLGLAPRRGEVIFFQPPLALRGIANERRATAGQSALGEGVLFVKRVAAVPGMTVAVDGDGTTHVTSSDGKPFADGQPPQTGGTLASLVRPAPPKQLQSGAFWVLGDNADVSIDSRCWGELSEGQLVGRPLARVFPPSRFGMVR